MGVSYSKSGIHLGAAYELLKEISHITQKPISHFASVVELPPPKSAARPRRLAISVDGVGTKVELLSRLGRHWISGWDCVAMNANDLLCVGAKPLWGLDYYAQGRLSQKACGGVIAGIQKALSSLGAELIGGETAELPGLFAKPALYDVAGMVIGEVPAGLVLGPCRVSPGDLLIGLASSGPHSNGFSLIRKALTFSEIAKQARTLLAPTRLYHSMVYPLLCGKNSRLGVKSIAHITGGAFYEKLPRAIGPKYRAVIFWGSWKVPPIFSYLQEKTGLTVQEICGVLNMGIGLVLIADPKKSQALLRVLGGNARVIGEVRSMTRGSPAVSIE